ncbi:MAG: hypothetical protein ACOQNV_02180 [Mycoplasmoidaceae bacterium]
MKTITKILLPLSTLVATTSMVTPLAACNKENDEWANAVDLMTYEPDPELIYEGDPLTKDDATDALFGAENAITLVKQDIYTYLAWEFKNELPFVLALLGIYWAGEAQTVVGSLSDLDLEYNSTEHQAILSGTIRLKAVCDMLNASEEKIGTYSIETTHKINNVPYSIVHTEWAFGEYWTSYFKLEDLEEKTNWYVDRSYNAFANYNNPTTPDEHESSSIRFSYLNIATEGYYDELTMIRWWSYYLNGAEPA